jgi:putative phage-type endonuclease
MFLEELVDISDELVTEDSKSVFDSDEHVFEFMETVFLLMDEYVKNDPTAIADPDFNENLFEDIKHIFEVQFEDQFDDYMCMYSDESDMDELFEYAFHVYISSFLPERSIDHASNMTNSNKNINTCITHHPINQDHIQLIEDKINKLRNIPQPVQRTPGWYTFRHNLITASNAHKAFDSKSSINQLIYEKCQPVKSDTQNEEIKMTNLNTPLHWGQKYEPLSVIIYEHLYNTTVEDFGCLPHTQYSFIGASPDGIIVNQESDRFGRMLEIKNVVSREITGIPKKEYWVQMQLQMEVCDLDECDFLETKFIEYTDSIHYEEDIDTPKTDGKKGIFMYFNTYDLKPFYVYKPLNIINQVDVDLWMENTMELYHGKNKSWIKNVYWKLEKLSCVLVLRNKEWFKNNVAQLENVWNMIKHDRINGFEHRAPAKRPAKTSAKPYVSGSGCLLNVIKINTEKLHDTTNIIHS